MTGSELNENDAEDEDIALDEVFAHSSPQERAEGWRLHLFRERHGNVHLAEELVLPEKIDDINAHRVIKSNRLTMNEADVEWLHGRLGAIREQFAAEKKERDLLAVRKSFR